MAPADPSLTSLSSPSSSTSKSVNNRLSANFNSTRIAAAVSLTSIRETILQENSRTEGGTSLLSGRELTTSASVEQHDSLLFQENRSYNKLSLQSRGKKRKIERQHLSWDGNCIDPGSLEDVEETFKLPRFSSRREDFSIDESAGAVKMNGHGVSGSSGSSGSRILDSRYSSSSSSGGVLGLQAGKANSPPVASLSNLGNTCFLNSVLYTLRFTPGFLHSMHHLVHDLGLQGSGNNGKKRNVNGTGGVSVADAELVHDVVDQLHDLFKSMSCIDEAPESSREPIPPSSFLHAIGKLNPMFAGNHQQDAHELLVTVINTLQDIKIPIPSPPVVGCPPSVDAVDFAKEDPNKKGAKKKSGKSIFYSVQQQQQNQCSAFSASSSSNGLRSSTSKLEQIQISNRSGLKAAPPANGNAPAVKDAYLPNFVKDNFVGKSLMGTRCLECEASTFRSETFTNIDIPLTFDGQDEPDSLSVKDLFLKQIMASETLRENNKYWCSECSRLNEAQRSVQYEVLPRVMVLQLKRFTATGNKSYTSKINEYIPTPFTMNCFCTQCMPGGQCSSSSCSNQQTSSSGSKHHYKLYAVIMHLGATLASGHYTAYVRVGDQAAEYKQCYRSDSAERKNKSGKGIRKYFSRSSAEQRHNGSAPAAGSNANGVTVTGGANGSTPNDLTGVCKSASCCGVRTSGQLSFSGSSVSCSSAPSLGSVSTPLAASSGSYHVNGSMAQRSLDSVDSGTPSDCHSGSQDEDEMWLECDDETIHVISRGQFEEDLGCNRGFTTPYLLFYQRV